MSLANIFNVSAGRLALASSPSFQQNLNLRVLQSISSLNSLNSDADWREIAPDQTLHPGHQIRTHRAYSTNTPPGMGSNRKDIVLSSVPESQKAREEQLFNRESYEKFAREDRNKAEWERKRFFPYAQELIYLNFVVFFGIGAYSAVMQAEENVGPNSKFGVCPEQVTNWSGTHSVSCRRVFRPNNTEEVVDLVNAFFRMGRNMRPLGSGLSPNGIAFRKESMICLKDSMNNVVSVDVEKKQVTAQAGMTVNELIHELEPYGLTLQNYASIAEQTLGGFYQIGAHGTGARIPPVDEQVVKYVLVSPQVGAREVSPTLSSELFHMARVAFGTLGVVTQYTIQCVDRHLLQEKQFTATRAEVKKNHTKWLQQHKHLRYMWIPYTDTVVVVTCDPATKEPAPEPLEKQLKRAKARVAPMVTLLRENSDEWGEEQEEHYGSMSFAQLRDELIKFAPLDVDWIREVNSAEAKYWKIKDPPRTDYSDKILGFDCGGQQWVHEIAFPCGTVDNPDHKDIDYMLDLLNYVEKKKLPAPAPIEQRWSCGSTSYMSPVYAAEEADKKLFSWVGIIMYLPSEDEAEREAIATVFNNDYVSYVQQSLMPRYNAKWHWAKIQVPGTQDELLRVQTYLEENYPVQRYQAFRKRLDSKNMFWNGSLRLLFPVT